jgi:hypothetical protein
VSGPRRVYLPSSLRLLREALERGELGPAPLPGHAVTGTLSSALGTTDEEELEFAAMTAASLDSVRLLAGEDPPVRVVVAVDVTAVRETGGSDEDPSAVVVAHPVPLRRIAAAHVDSPDAAVAVSAARDTAPGDAAEEEALGRCLDHDLEWYAASELMELVDTWSTAP